MDRNCYGVRVKGIEMTDEETAEALLKITHLLIRADNLFGEMNKDFLTIYEVDELLALAKKLKVEAER